MRSLLNSPPLVTLVLALALSALLPAHAQVRYSVPLDGTAAKLWSTKDTKLVCSLIHDIPKYGYAEFKTVAGRELRSSLEIVPRLGINDRSEMRFIAAKPEWQSGGNETLLGRIEIFNGFNPFAGATLTWKILSALNNGKQVLMPYTDGKLAPGENIVPTLSPLGFDKPYEAYLVCQHNLLRVGFNDVRMLPLAFKFQQKTLTAPSEARIRQQLDYVKADPSIAQITIRAFAYDMRTRTDNMRMADERAAELQKMFIDAGVDGKLINVVKFNAMSLPRDRDNPPPNREVTARNAIISLEREETLVDHDLDVALPDVGAESGEE